MSIEILTGFDGSSPSSDNGVNWTDGGNLLLLPHLAETADGKPQRGSRLWTRLRNTSDAMRPLRVTVDWQHDGDGAEGHDVGFVRHERQDDWRMIPGARLDERRIEYALRLLPGLTDLALYPDFSTADCAAFVKGLDRQQVAAEVIGRSAEGREIWMLSYPSSSPRALPFFMQARDHGYESAGCYCAVGINDFLLSDDPLAEYLRAKFSVHIVPMTNPDAVANGLSRFTRAGGADMNRVHTAADPAHDALRAALDRVAPVVHMNVHNWTCKFIDGLLVNEARTAELIQQHMPADHAHAKRWSVEVSPRYRDGADPSSADPASRSWKNYCKERFDAIAVTYEFPWFSLNTRDMRRKGARAFAALALAAVEQKRL